MNDKVVIRELRVEDYSAAIGVISRGMRDNPLHIQAFGTDPNARVRALSRMFDRVFPVLHRKGIVLGAYNQEQLVGVLGVANPGQCQATLAESLNLLPRILSSIGVRRTFRVAWWVNSWKKKDLHEPHWHLGPVAVDSHMQGRRIGSAMMVEYCARLDKAKLAGYLETDKAINVAFYEKFGFQTISTANVLETPNWFMRRPKPASPSADANNDRL